MERADERRRKRAFDRPLDGPKEKALIAAQVGPLQRTRVVLRERAVETREETGDEIALEMALEMAKQMARKTALGVGEVISARFGQPPYTQSLRPVFRLSAMYTQKYHFGVRKTTRKHPSGPVLPAHYPGVSRL